MIRYDKGLWGIYTLKQWYGSPFPRTLLFSLLSALAAALLRYFGDDWLGDTFEHHYPFQAFVFVVGFMLVFRTQLAYGRYWEGQTQLHNLSSKLTDVVVQCITFDKIGRKKTHERKDFPTTEPGTNSERGRHKSHCLFRDSLIHTASLLHATALMTLRHDYNLYNLEEHNSLDPVPLDNLYQNRLEEENKNEEAEDSVTDSVGKPFIMPEFAAKRSQLRSGGFWAVMKDLFVLRTDNEMQAHINKQMPMSVIGRLTEQEQRSLGSELTKTPHQLHLAMKGVYAVDNHGNQINWPAPPERVHVVHTWLQQQIIARIEDNGIAVMSSIQSRIHTALSSAMQGFEQCKKLNETPFPFPWAQGITITLIVFLCMLPFIVARYVHGLPEAIIATFLISQTYMMLNEVAQDLEDAFHYDPNQLPLPQMQFRFNERLLAVSRAEKVETLIDQEQQPLSPVANTAQYNAPVLGGQSPTRGSTDPDRIFGRVTLNDNDRAALAHTSQMQKQRRKDRRSLRSLAGVRDVFNTSPRPVHVSGRRQYTPPSEQTSASARTNASLIPHMDPADMARGGFAAYHAQIASQERIPTANRAKHSKEGERRMRKHVERTGESLLMHAESGSSGLDDSDEHHTPVVDPASHTELMDPPSHPIAMPLEALHAQSNGGNHAASSRALPATPAIALASRRSPDGRKNGQSATQRTPGAQRPKSNGHQGQLGSAHPYHSNGLVPGPGHQGLEPLVHNGHGDGRQPNSAMLAGNGHRGAERRHSLPRGAHAEGVAGRRDQPHEHAQELNGSGAHNHGTSKPQHVMRAGSARHPAASPAHPGNGGELVGVAVDTAATSDAAVLGAGESSRPTAGMRHGAYPYAAANDGPGGFPSHPSAREGADRLERAHARQVRHGGSMSPPREQGEPPLGGMGGQGDTDGVSQWDSGGRAWSVRGTLGHGSQRFRGGMQGFSAGQGSQKQ